jgi:hypothetical protein
LKIDRLAFGSPFPRSAARMLPLVIIGLGVKNRVRHEGLLLTDMTKPNLTIPVYDVALRALKTSIVEGLVSTDPMLGQIASRTTGHAGPVRNVPGPNPVDHDRTQFRAEYSLHIDAIREMDVDTFIMAIYRIAEQYAEAMGATFFRTASDITEATGNSTDAEGRLLSWDLVLDELEKAEVAFDDDDQPTAQIVMSQNDSMMLHATEKTPEQERRYQEIMQRKKDAWDAQQRPRHLPRRHQGTGA